MITDLVMIADTSTRQADPTTPTGAATALKMRGSVVCLYPVYTREIINPSTAMS